MKQISLIVLACFFSNVSAHAQDFAPFQAKQLIHRGDTLPYRILYPDGYDPQKQYPVLFFLHGAGERGNDNASQLTHGAALFLKDSVRQAFPAIVVFPQCPTESFWSNVDIQSQADGRREFSFRTGGKPSEGLRLFLRLVKHTLRNEAVDKSRIYIGGLSMGAMGTYEALRRKPRLFAAAFAICGGDNTFNVKKYAHVPLWIFHGEQDDVVPPTHSHAIVAELKRIGANPKYTFYPTANHNSWDAAFAEPELLPWLFSHTKM
ncbi:prolyl oligopeptidase family serine peptidase [Parapedobacter sp. ISTM3]|uniref:carboxylesterase family protein n=1 Tax=Parapedobacter sp. ISTM3 TaxID=2800130 RepID=UPI0019032A2D|nr:prolyl oligopeptidase family serine peptidase [Parapedobacter sp. ISTM3]MBK1442166.1 prolyl oligopeptidase family serine peptidase [Parapedobacter sp. ISTM3]